MAAQGEISVSATKPTPAAKPTTAPEPEAIQTEYQKNLAAWNARKHNDPAYLAHKAASEQEEASAEASTYGDLPGFGRLPAKMQQEFRAVMIDLDLLHMWERDRHVTCEEAGLLRQILPSSLTMTPEQIAEHDAFID
jgi:hypothetical protein